MYKRTATILLLFTWSILLAHAPACSKSPESQSPLKCEVADEVSSIKTTNNAGCMIKIDGKAILVDEGEGVSFPGGKPKVIDDVEEIVWETACRETQEEIIVAPIRIEKLLYHSEKFYLFHCSPDKDTADKLKKLGSYTRKDLDPEKKTPNYILLEDPHKIPPEKWRFPQKRDEEIRLFDGLD